MIHDDARISAAVLRHERLQQGSYVNADEMDAGGGHCFHGRPVQVTIAALWNIRSRMKHGSTEQWWVMAWRRICEMNRQASLARVMDRHLTSINIWFAGDSFPQQAASQPKSQQPRQPTNHPTAGRKLSDFWTPLGNWSLHRHASVGAGIGCSMVGVLAWNGCIFEGCVCNYLYMFQWLGSDDLVLMQSSV